MIEFGLKAIMIIFISLVVLPLLGILMCIPVLNVFIYKRLRQL